MKFAVIGATGLVGGVLLKVLKERNFPITQLLAVASKKSIGKKITFNGKTVAIIGIEDALALKPDLSIFSAGSEISLEWAPKFVEAGTTVIDNSSAWRMDTNTKLIVRESC